MKSSIMFGNRDLGEKQVFVVPHPVKPDVYFSNADSVDHGDRVQFEAGGMISYSCNPYSSFIEFGVREQQERGFLRPAIEFISGSLTKTLLEELEYMKKIGINTLTPEEKELIKKNVGIVLNENSKKLAEGFKSEEEIDHTQYFSWDDVPGRYNYVAIDECGDVHAYEKEPRDSNNFKEWLSEAFTYQMGNAGTEQPNWKNLIWKRRDK